MPSATKARRAPKESFAYTYRDALRDVDHARRKREPEPTPELYARICRCAGNVFEPDHCFDCGHDLTNEAAEAAALERRKLENLANLNLAIEATRERLREEGHFESEEFCRAWFDAPY